jgi:hypothetical protein
MFFQNTAGHHKANATSENRIRAQTCKPRTRQKAEPEIPIAQAENFKGQTTTVGVGLHTHYTEELTVQEHQNTKQQSWANCLAVT